MRGLGGLSMGMQRMLARVDGKSNFLSLATYCCQKMNSVRTHFCQGYIMGGGEDLEVRHRF